MIELLGLVKKYGGVTGVDGISLSIGKGRVLGLLGKNGAGKTTTINILTGYICPDEGQVLVDGVDLRKNPVAAKSKFGYLPENPPLYNELTVEEYLMFVTRLRGVEMRRAPGIVEAAMRRLSLTDVKRRVIGVLSKGYRQRVGIAQALCGDAKIIVLDEPASGLDPAQIVELRGVIREMKGEYTVLLSSHILSEVAGVCDDVAIIDRGRLIVSDTIESIIAKNAGTHVEAEVEGNASDFCAALRRLDGVCEVYEDGRRVKVLCGRDVRREIFSAAVETGAVLLSMRSEDTLEDIFLKLVGGD